MKLVVVGLGVQGRKRQAMAGERCVATVDPIHPQADRAHLHEVPLDSYQAALICTPDDTKAELIHYCLKHGKHVLVEKPLLLPAEQLAELQALAESQGLTVYTAYNHRFEPHLASLRQALQQERLGQLLWLRIFYGNGTAREVRGSWRDQGLGVICDLGSHLLDLALFLLDDPSLAWQLVRSLNLENLAPDYFAAGSLPGRPSVWLEGTYLSWRNTFSLDLVGSQGSAQVQGLCKWGPASLTFRRRVLPSGKPPEECYTLEQADPTWAEEMNHFERLCQRGQHNLGQDRILAGWMEQLAR